MTKPDAGISADFDLAVTVAQDIFCLFSEPKALLDQSGRLLAQSPRLDENFRAALHSLAGATGEPTAATELVLRDFPPSSPLAGCRLVEPAPSRCPTADPGLLHDLRDLLHSLQLASKTAVTGADSGAIPAEVAMIATQVETLLQGREVIEEVDLGAALRHLTAALNPVIADAGADLKLEIPALELRSPVPRKALLRLVQNLLLNAARHSPGGEVVLALHAAEDHHGAACIEVTDGGKGLSPDQIAWLTGAPTAKAPKPRGGHGYGLSIIREALNQTGARLEQLPGKPHRLRLHLPASRTEVELLNGRRVWLVEDNEASAALMAQLLRSAGADCETYLSGEALLEAAAEATQQPDLVLCDYFLGDHNGAELCRLLISSGFTAPVAVLTADPSAETAALCRVSGAAEVWFKPLSGSVLIARIESLLASSQALPPAAPAIFDPEIGSELIEDAGLSTTVKFMQRALQEARDISPLCQGGGIEILRSALHSAVGASGITGLRQLNHRLKEMHVKIVSHAPFDLEFAALQRTIEKTARAIAEIDPNETKPFPKEQISL